MRWAFLLVCLIATLSTVPHVFEGKTGWPLRAAALASFVWLVWHWIRGYRRGRFSLVLAPIEGLAVLIICLSIETPPHALGLIYNALVFRALYGNSREVPSTFVAYAGSFLAAVTLTPLLGGPRLPLDEFLPHVLGLTLLCGTFYFVRSVIKRHERTLAREEILRRAGAALVAANDRESVNDAALEAALDLTGSTPNVQVGLSRGTMDRMTVVAAAGYRASEIRGHRLDLGALPWHLRSRLLERQPAEIERQEDGELLRRLGLASETRPFFLIPLFIEDEPRGTIRVTSDTPLVAEVKEGLVALSFQVALALEGVAYAEDRNWRQSEVRFRSLIQNSSDIIMVLGADGTINYISPSVQGILGHAPEGLIGNENFALVHPDDLMRVRHFHEENVTRSGVSPALEARLRHADGSWRHFEGTGNNLLDDPDVAGIVVNLRDVTERRRTEEALRMSEASLAEAQRIAHLGSWEAVRVEQGAPRAEDEIHWSDEMFRIFGFAPQEFVPTFEGLIRAIHHEDRAYVEKTIADAESGGASSLSFEHRILRSDGEIRFVHVRMEIVYGEDGDRLYSFGTVLDITERKKAEEERNRQARYAALRAEVSASLAETGTLQSILQRCAEHMVRRLDLALAYIWTLGDDGNILELEASAGTYVDPQLQVPVGDSKIGQIVRGRLPHVSNDGEWAEREGIVAFAGHPLIVDARVVGVMAMYARQPLQDDAIEALGSVADAIAQGIQRKLAMEALRESEERFRLLAENAQDLICRYRIKPTPGFEYVSPSATTITGYTPEEYYADPELAYRIVHPEDRHLLTETLRHPEASSVIRWIRKDGSVVWTEQSQKPIYDEAGELVAIEGIARDVTERKRVEEALRETQEFLGGILDNAPLPIYGVSEEGRIRLANRFFADFVGMPQEKVIGSLLEDVFTEEEARQFRENNRRVIETETALIEEEWAEIPDGRRYFQTIKFPLRGPDMRTVAIGGISLDITERRRSEEALKSSEEFFRALYENVQHPSFIVDKDLNFFDVNPYACEFYGYSREEFRQMNISDITLPEEYSDQQKFLEIMRRQGGVFIRERRHRKKNGEIITVTVDVARITRSGEEMYVAKITDITERKRAEDQLSHQAFHDPLTGLPNRALFSDRLGHALARAERHPESVAILFLDLDNFKVINDSLGHRAGDDLLISTAERLRRCLPRPGDTVARLSGDEFTVLLEDMTDRREAIRVAQRIAEQMEKPFALKGREAFTTTSIGIAFASSSTDQPDDLLRKADIAMYRAKGNGKSGFMVFDPRMDAEVHSRLRMESELRRAVERDEFVLHYQIKVELDGTGKSGGREVEALVRWQHPDKGLLEAMQFIPLAEETGLIIPMGRAILEKACTQAREWQEGSGGMSLYTVCVNLSGRQFQDPGLSDVVGGVLRDIELDPSRLVLEITESVLMEDVQAAAITLRELKELGVRIAVDDFGMGYSSLSYLKNFPVDILKIDRSFVERLESDPASKTIVAATIDLAHALGMRVVAEGVEMAEQLELLIAMGCDTAQGFYFSEPVPAEKIPALPYSSTARNL